MLTATLHEPAVKLLLNQLILWSLLLAPLASLLLMRRQSLKYYMPAAMFTALLVTIVHEIGFYYRWWVIQEAIFPWGYITSLPITFGVYFAGTLWIFYFTYPNSRNYIAANAVYDGVIAFVFIPFFLEPRGIVAYEALNPWMLWLLSVSQAFVIYGYHKWQEAALQPHPRPAAKRPVVIDMQSWISRKQRIR